LGAYAITAFIISALTGAISSTGTSSTSSSTTISAERLSGSLGSGGLSDHYPARNATEVARNTRIFVTFKEAMDIESFIEGYDVNGTPEDLSDDTVDTALNADNIIIYQSADEDGTVFASTEVSVTFTDDLKTFVFDTPLLGSPTDDTSYTVFLDDSIKTAEGSTVLNGGGYEWSFEVGTEIDLTPPSVRTVTPVASGSYDRNITVEITFSEAVDLTSATGIRGTDSGFDNIQVTGDSGTPTAGEYVISNGYRTVTFTSDDPCGTNSCGQTIYCLPGSQPITVTVGAPTIGAEPPQVDISPYDGIADTSGNGLDGDGDGTAGDDYVWSFTTTGDISLDAPVIVDISPNILEEDVALDQTVLVTFDSIMMTSTLTSSTDTENFIDLTSSPLHEMWYTVWSNSLDIFGGDTSETGLSPVVTQAEIYHGVFFESVDTATYYYTTDVGDGVKNQYQNCFAPGEGPDTSGGSCGTDSDYPYCCNGAPSDNACSFFSS